MIARTSAGAAWEAAEAPREFAHAAHEKVQTLARTAAPAHKARGLFVAKLKRARHVFDERRHIGASVERCPRLISNPAASDRCARPEDYDRPRQIELGVNDLVKTLSCEKFVIPPHRPLARLEF